MEPCRPDGRTQLKIIKAPTGKAATLPRRWLDRHRFFRGSQGLQYLPLWALQKGGRARGGGGALRPGLLGHRRLVQRTEP